MRVACPPWLRQTTERMMVGRMHSSVTGICKNEINYTWLF